MKGLFLFLILFNFELGAVTVDTNQSATLIDPVNTSEATKLTQAMVAVASKKSGLSVQQVNQQFNFDPASAAVVLRQYHARIPAKFGQNRQWFNVVVDAQKFNQLMLTQGIPLWPDQRQEVFVMLVEETENEPLKHVAAAEELAYWLKKWFDVMGIPVKFYDPSEADMLAFLPTDVRYLNPDLVDQIHANNPDSVALLVFVNKSRRGYSYRFGLSRIDQPMVIKNLQFVDLGLGMNALVSSVQSLLSKGQTIKAEDFIPHTIAVNLNDVFDANQMLQTINYLDQHALIEAYQVNGFKANKLQVMIKIRVKPEAFIHAVEQDGKLQHVPVDIGRSVTFKLLQ